MTRTWRHKTTEEVQNDLNELLRDLGMTPPGCKRCERCEAVMLERRVTCSECGKHNWPK